MNSRQLKYVLALANEGTFLRAASALGISQPSLSQYIKKIETQLGIELFDRSNGSVRLTDAGRVYIESGRKILEAEREMESRFQDILMSRYGSVRVGISAHRSVRLMPPVVKAFREKYPGVIASLIEKARGSLMEAAEHGDFDICVTTLPVDENIYNVEPLFHEELLLAVPRDSAICRKLSAVEVNGTIDIAQIDGCDFAMLNEDHLMQHQLVSLMNKHRLQLNKTVECTSLETLLAMVRAGVGAAVIPACLSNFSDDNIVCYHFMQETAKRDIVAIYRKDHFLSKAAIDFIGCMKDMLK